MDKALLLFTKVPEPGYVKTRLSEGENALSPHDACQLYSAALLDVFDVMIEASKSLGARLYVAYTPSERGFEITKILSNRSVPVSFFAQEGLTTGDKIVHAFHTAFAGGHDALVMVFGDQPGLSEGLLAEAFRSLLLGRDQNRSHLVLGPTCDGGTYLIGLTGSLLGWIPGAIDCSNSAKAVSKLIVRGTKDQIPHSLLRELVDLDDMVDLEHYLRNPLASSRRISRVLNSIPDRRNLKHGNGLSVIIPTLNEEDTLARTIRSLRGQKSAPREIIVVDCGSTDSTMEVANAMADRVIVVPRCGRQYQENVGARGAKGDVLLFLHADTLVSPTLLRSVTKAVEDEEVVGGGARLRYSSNRVRYRALCILRDGVSKALGIFGMGSSFFVRREAFHDAGRFDEYVNEEGVVMSRRLRSFGKLVMVDDFVQTSPRRYEKCGFVLTLSAWMFTIALSYLGVRAGWVERHIWRVVR